jgi:hypothetical protein
MNIIMLLWWSLGHGNPVVPSRWQATSKIRWSVRHDSNPVPHHIFRAQRLDARIPLFSVVFEDFDHDQSGVKWGSGLTRARAQNTGPYCGAEGIRTPDPLDANSVWTVSTEPDST